MHRRDVKPQNLLLNHYSSFPFAVLADFGELLTRLQGTRACPSDGFAHIALMQASSAPLPSPQGP